METKTIDLRKDQRRFAKYQGFNVSQRAREWLNKAIAGKISHLPTGDTRRHKFERVRTQVSLKKDHVRFINKNNLILSQLVQDSIQAPMDRELQLQAVESGQTPLTSEKHLRIIKAVEDKEITGSVD